MKTISTFLWALSFPCTLVTVIFTCWPSDLKEDHNESSSRGSRHFAERRCTSGKLHFEKTTGYELIRGNPSRLFSDRDGGIIKDCSGRCESDARCMGFNMDYNRNECQAVTTSSENNLFNLRPSSGSSYFEGICLKGEMKLFFKIMTFLKILSWLFSVKFSVKQTTGRIQCYQA